MKKRLTGFRNIPGIAVLCLHCAGCVSMTDWYAFPSQDMVWYQKGMSVSGTRDDHRKCKENHTRASALRNCMLEKGYVMIPREEAELLRVRALQRKGLNKKEIAQRLHWPVTKVSRYMDERYTLAPVENLGKQPVDILANLGRPGVELLIAELKSTDALVRRQAAQALGEIGDPHAVEPLLALVHDHNPLVRRHAVEALGKIGSPQSVLSLAKVLINVSEATHVRADAAAALGKIGEPEAVPFLIHALSAPDWSLRSAVTVALGIIGDPRAVQPLIARLADGDTQTRGYAAQALGRIGDIRAAEPLRLMLVTETDKHVRKKAEQALTKFERREVHRVNPFFGD